MDPDAPPLVKADTLASQGEQLSSRRAYQQALGAHTEAAEQYQLAAQATSDVTAAKALLLQRDKQIKLANEVQRKLERGKSKPAAVTPSSTTSTTCNGTTATGGGHAAVQALHTTQSTRGYGGPHYQPPSAGGSSSSSNHGQVYRRNYNGTAVGSGPSLMTMTGMTGLQQQYSPAGRMNIGTAGAFVTLPPPKDRIDASTANMADSRYSRKSNSPSQSQISHSLPHSGGESVKTSSVEESYYLMNTENDPADPVTTFLNVVENMVEELGNAVAFASAPLHIGPPGPSLTDANASAHARRASDSASNPKSKAHATRDVPSNQVLESFYVVPSINRLGKSTRGNSAPLTEEHESSSRSSSGGASNKTHEELVEENNTLKETLDQLSKRLDWITKERLKEKETLKDSVTIFVKDFKKQAERLGQSSIINFNDNKRQMPPHLSQIPSHTQHSNLPIAMNNNHNNSQTDELQKRISYLQEELRLSKLETEKQTANAQRYKARYDDLRKAILEKRKAKEMALAAAAGSTGGESGAPLRTDNKTNKNESVVKDLSDQNRTTSPPAAIRQEQAKPMT